jgi:hypothetical protein
MCSSVISATAALTVNLNSTITLSSAAGTDAQTKCINTALTPITYAIGGGGTGASITTGTLPAGVTGSFSGGVFTISGTPTAPGSFNYTITTTGPCANVTANGTITVNPNSTISLTSAVNTDAQTLCVNNPLTPITYAIGGGGTGASITAGALPAGVTGSFSGGVFTISGTPTATGTFNYTVTTTGPCTNVTANGTITVNANSTINLTSAAGTDGQTKCINTALTPITYAIGGGATGASITVGTLPAGVTGSFSGGVFTISGTPTAPGSFNYTITTTGPCTNVTASGTITVNANSTISLTSAPNTNAQTICVNTALAPITYAIGGGGTGASITAGALPAGVTGSFSGGVFTISGTPTATGTFNYTVTTAGPCTNVSSNGTITVNQNSTLTLTGGSNNQPACINTPITNITYAVGGGATGATASGLPAGVTGTYNAGVFTISGSPTAAGTYNYSVTTTGPCNNVTLNGTITVSALPTGGTISPAVTSACVNTAGGTLTLSGYSGNIIRWESSINGGATWTPIANTTTTQTYTTAQTIIYRAVIQSGPCPVAYSAVAVISVITQQPVTATANPTAVCLGQSAVLTSGGGLPVSTGGIPGGDFNNGNPPGWCVDGQCSGSYLPANGDNQQTGPWRETNDHVFVGIDFHETPSGGKFAIANGVVTSVMTTPVFSLIGQSPASFDFFPGF